MHQNVGLVDDLASAMGVNPVDIRLLLNTVGVPWSRLEGRDCFSRRHLVSAFQSGLVKAPEPSQSATALYSLEEASERYTASLPTEGMPY